MSFKLKVSFIKNKKTGIVVGMRQSLLASSNIAYFLL